MWRAAAAVALAAAAIAAAERTANASDAASLRRAFDAGDVTEILLTANISLASAPEWSGAPARVAARRALTLRPAPNASPVALNLSGPIPAIVVDGEGDLQIERMVLRSAPPPRPRRSWRRGRLACRAPARDLALGRPVPRRVVRPLKHDRLRGWRV